LKRTVTLS